MQVERIRFDMTSSSIPLIDQAYKHGDNLAILSPEGAFSYRRLLDISGCIASGLLRNKDDLDGERVAYLIARSFVHVAVQWGIWRAGGIAVPLCDIYPPAELEYVIRDSGATKIVVHPDFASRIQSMILQPEIQVFSTDDLMKAKSGMLPRVGPNRRAMILYTSGTTGRPKGVVSTHLNINAQIKTLVDAWEWSNQDHILLVLPLHHVHGIINVLSCALWTGARCTIFPGFDAAGVWQEFVEGDLTLFMAVPTVYVKLISAWKESHPEDKMRMKRACDKFRVMVSGSAALPVSVFDGWREITGHTMLERYGMTEIGMALSNPYHGERRRGHVGVPLPGVEVRIVDDAGNRVPVGNSGEIQVKGPSVFSEYWQRPGETEKSFRDGWFRTGDVGIVENGYYRIMGRMSTDIIKTGGYKVSGLEIEEVLRTHPYIEECAVLGMDDPEWGERVCAAIVLMGENTMSVSQLRTWAKECLAPYKVPSLVLFVDELPRNALGKVVKPDIKVLFCA